MLVHGAFRFSSHFAMDTGWLVISGITIGDKAKVKSTFKPFCGADKLKISQANEHSFNDYHLNDGNCFIRL